jgi:transposase-like protein
MPVRDRGLSTPMIRKLWSGVKDFAEEEISLAARKEIKAILEKGMLDEFEHLVGCRSHERSGSRLDYRNGFYTRGLLTTLGYISGIRVPRARSLTFRTRFFGWYRRRRESFDMAVLQCFVTGTSMRKVRGVARAFSGAGISASAVSRILKGVDQEVAAYRKSPITGSYRFLFIDGLWMSVRKRYDRKSPVLFAMGIDQAGRKVLLGFKLAFAESQMEWAAFLEDLRKRGLRDDNLELIVHDGAGGIAAALGEVFPYTPTQLCAEHKIRAAAAHLRDKSKRSVFLAGARAIYREAQDVPDARQRLDQFSERWFPDEPRAVRSLRRNFGWTLVYMQFQKHLWKTLRTTNPIERYQEEIRRRTDPMRSFADDRSCERIVYALTTVLDPGMPS